MVGDLDILAAIDNTANEDGWATPGDIAFTMYGPSRDGRAVTWALKRLRDEGLVESGPYSPWTWSGTWGLTEAGIEFLMVGR